MNKSRIITIGSAAAVLALTAGTASAATTFITSKDIKDGAVHKVDLSPGVNKTLNRSVAVSTLKHQWTVRAGDAAGAHLTGDGIAFGPLSANQCSTPGQDFARVDFSGLNGQPLSSLRNLVVSGRYQADGDTGGVGSPAIRVFFTGHGTGGDGVDEDNRLTYSPNAQDGSANGTGNDTPYETHEWIVTSGTVRYNDDSDSAPAQAKPFVYLNFTTRTPDDH